MTTAAHTQRQQPAVHSTCVCVCSCTGCILSTKITITTLTIKLVLTTSEGHLELVQRLWLESGLGQVYSSLGPDWAYFVRVNPILADCSCLHRFIFQMNIIVVNYKLAGTDPGVRSGGFQVPDLGSKLVVIRLGGRAGGGLETKPLIIKQRFNQRLKLIKLIKLSTK